jgi:tetratricopeptide (TPR) repeat protein
MKQEINSTNTLIKLFITLFFISFNAGAQDFSEKNEACNAALDKGNVANAIVISDEILKQEPNNHNALLCKGRALGAQGKYDAALSVIALAAKQSKLGFDEIISYLLIGNLHLGNKKPLEAIASYEKSLKICEAEKNDKFRLINHNLIGEAHAQNNDLNAALTSYVAGSKLTKNDNERADSYERLGATYSALGQYDLAIEHQLKAVNMQKRSGTLDQYANASLGLGQVYGKAKDYPSAEKTYTKFIQFAKDNGGAYYEARASYELAQIKSLSGDAASSKVMMGDALKIAKNIGAGDLASEIEASIKKLSD